MMMKNDILTDPRFAGIEPFKSKVWLSSPTMHGDEQRWMNEAIQTNWVSTVGANINEIEKQIAKYMECGYAVALSAGTAAIHIATKLAGEKLYGFGRPCICSRCILRASLVKQRKALYFAVLRYLAGFKVAFEGRELYKAAYVCEVIAETAFNKSY